MADMPGGERELDACLDQVVADGDLAAKCVAPARRAELLEIVRIGLDQDGHIQA